MTDINKLIERLSEATLHEKNGKLVKRLRNPNGPEAATALQTLKEENERLRDDIARHMEIANSEANRGEKLLAENEQMAEALEQAAMGFNSCNTLIKNLCGTRSIMVETFAERARASLPKETDNG